MPGKIMSPEERLRRKNAFDAQLVMGAADFTKATGRDRHLADEPKPWLDPDGGGIKAGLVRDRDCPVCGDRFDRPLFVKDGFVHGRCPDCGLIYVNPVLKDDLVLAHYQAESSWVQVLESGPQIEFDRLKYEYGLDVAEPHLAGRRLLDLGAGSGLFLRVAAGRGYEAAGLELHQGNAERLRAEGFRVVDRPLEDAGFGPDSFDLVTLWEVLEHIVEPARLLERIRRVLAPGGAAFILVPNADSLASRVLHEKSGTFGGHSHVNFFNRRTLQRLLNLTGFDLIEAETIVSELGTVTNHLNFEDPYLGNRREAFDFLTPELIHDRLMGSKLLAVARPAS